MHQFKFGLSGFDQMLMTEQPVETIRGGCREAFIYFQAPVERLLQ